MSFKARVLNLLFPVLVLLAVQPAGATVSDVGTLTPGSGSFACNSQLTNFAIIEGYAQGGYGSYSPAQLTGGRTVLVAQNVFATCTGSETQGVLIVGGFSADPGIAWLTSVTRGIATHQGSAASYSYSGGSATWTFSNSILYLNSGNNSSPTTTCTIVHE